MVFNIKLVLLMLLLLVLVKINVLFVVCVSNNVVYLFKLLVEFISIKFKFKCLYIFFFRID